MSTDAVSRFVSAVRRRLWLQSLLEQARIAIWAGSLTLLSIACINAWLMPVPAGATVALCLLATLLAMLPAAIRAPSLTASAVRADRHFGGQSLLTTALEADASGTSPAGRIVVSRASNAAADWSRRVESIWSAPPIAPFALAAIPLFAAAVLLAMSSSTASMTTERDRIVAGETNLQNGEDVRALRETLGTNTGGVSDRAAMQRARESTDSMSVPADAAPVATAGEEVFDAGDMTSPGFAAANRDGGVAPGSARQSQDATAMSAESTSFASREREQILRFGDQKAGRGETDAEFAETTFATAIAAGIVKPAAAPPDAGAWSALTAAEQAYARRLLAREAVSDD